MTAAQIPAAIAEKLNAAGRIIDPAASSTLYAPLQKMEPYGAVKVARDVKYGSAERHLLDVFAPEKPASDLRPVVVFVHGGAFTGGHKRIGTSPFYDNVMLWAVKNGMIGVNMTYRLAPQNPWPAAVEDVAAAIQWVRAHIKAHGGDPAKVYLVGHSAGAAHVASYVSHPEFHGSAGHGLAGAIFLSGVFDITTTPATPPITAYFGNDASLYSKRSALAGLREADIPLLVAYAERDPEDFEMQARQLNAALCNAKRCPTFVTFAGHGHMSEIHSVNTDDISVSAPMLKFIRQRIEK